jgi:hypothetical protein
MNVPASVERTLIAAHRAAIDEANEWRGRCVNLYGRAETKIAEALIAIEPDKKPPMLFSKKVERLQAIGGSAKLLGALQRLAALLGDRAALTHGAGKVWIDDKGKWLFTLEWAAGKTMSRRVFTRDEAAAFHDQVRAVTQLLESALKTSSRSSGPAGTPSA